MLCLGGALLLGAHNLDHLRRRDAQLLPVLQLFAGQPVVLHQDLFRDGILVGDVADILIPLGHMDGVAVILFLVSCLLRLFLLRLFLDSLGSSLHHRNQKDGILLQPLVAQVQIRIRLQDVVSLDPVGFRDGEQCLFFQHYM